MNEEIIMSKEAFEELVNGLEFIESLTLYGRKSLKYHIKRLQEENQQLKEQLQQKEDIINKAKEQLQKGITFCENDSQYAYNICVMAINREKKVLEILDNKGDEK